MRVLGIETSTLMVGVAILDQKGLVVEYRLEASRTRSERLMPMIDRALQDSQMIPQDLEGLAISIGPGSFTGLRVGLSTAKGLAFALGLPLVGVSTLEVLAAPLAGEASAWREQCACSICPMLDAKRQEVYAALFKASSEGELIKIMEEEAIAPSALMDRLMDRQETTVFLGTGAVLYETEIKKRLGKSAVFASKSDPYPSPSVVAELGMKRLRKGERDDPASLSPRYLSRFQVRAG